MSDENVGGLVDALTRIYNAGYASGHHDTVEGGYADVAFSDRSEYHREVIEELLADEAALSAHGQPVVGDSQRKWAQGLIEQLPREHDGRNSWLLNYGVGHESDWLRSEHKRYQEAWQDWREGYPKPTMRRYTGDTT